MTAEAMNRLDPHILKTWAGTVSGSVIVPGDGNYDEARRVWNLAVDRRPAAIVRCADRDDVARSIELARTHDATVAVRSGGHSQAGHGVCADGLVIDLSALCAIDVDVARRVARVSSGARGGAVLAAAGVHGLVTPMGGCPDVGVGGLTLGGGENFLMSTHGAVCDNLVSAEIVTADGSILTIGADQHADLFWAIRGGGGNFGVVTAFEYRLYPIAEVLSGQFLFPVERARETMLRYRELMLTAPDELTTSGGLTSAGEERSFFVALCVCGDRQAGEQLVSEWRTVLKPGSDNVTWDRYSGELVVPPAPSTGSGLFLPRLSDDVIDALSAAMAKAPPLATAVWNDFHGAVTRVPAQATAFALREPGFDLFANAAWNDVPGRAAAVAWVERLVTALRPAGRGVYVNNLNETEGHRVREAYGANYARLAAIKARYDPGNLFRVNHNIPPSL